MRENPRWVPRFYTFDEPRAARSCLRNEPSECRKEGIQTIRPRMQMIFQDPYSSLNGRMNVRQLIAEP